MSTPSPGTGAPSTAAAPSTSTPGTAPPTRKSSRGALGAVVAVVVIVVIVVALLLTGVIPGLHSSSPGSSSSGTGQGTASQAAQKFANGTSGGPWSGFEIIGVDSTIGETVESANLTNASCPLQGGSVSAITVPAYTGAYANGAPQDWLFGYESTSAATTLLVWVHGGTATGLGELTGSTCALRAPLLPTNLISSSAAASDAVATSNGTKFVDTFASANATYLAETQALGSVTSTFWYLEFSACAGQNYTSFDAVLNATTGAVSNSDYATAAASSLCGAKAPLGSALALGNPRLTVGGSDSTFAATGCAAGDYCYDVTVEEANPGLLASNLEFEVKTATGAVLASPGSGGFSFLSINGTVVAQSPPTGAGGAIDMTSWAFGGGTEVNSLLTLIVDMGTTADPAGNGYVLVTTGVNGYSGTVSLNLP